ncbi:MAG: hypothetical protein Ct9H90mP7_2520 [Candidatus Neomarinimicrobiota bacterium]|nr:MAG: hypothetical protein Ct9H90mP7_2520 [Candidatus Neomarinimicrobiota bacterium]
MPAWGFKTSHQEIVEHVKLLESCVIVYPLNGQKNKKKDAFFSYVYFNFNFTESIDRR